MKYSLPLRELINRPIIRNDQPEEFLNKMTDEEISIWEKEVEQTLNEENVPHIFPQWNVEVMTKTIDRGIIYSMVKMEAEQDQANQKILDIVKSKVTEDEFIEIKWVIDESDNTYNYLITDKPVGTFQDEDYEHIEGIYVNQTTNGGYTGDDFAGTISIQIGEYEYLQFSYSM